MMFLLDAGVVGTERRLATGPGRGELVLFSYAHALKGAGLWAGPHYLALGCLRCIRASAGRRYFSSTNVVGRRSPGVLALLRFRSYRMWRRRAGGPAPLGGLLSLTNMGLLRRGGTFEVPMLRIRAAAARGGYRLPVSCSLTDSMISCMRRSCRSCRSCRSRSSGELGCR
jgi:hypothetical protein